MKFRSKWLFLILMLLTGISLVLTTCIVFRPVEIFYPNLSSQSMTSNNRNIRNQIETTYAIEDVFKPTRFIYSHDNQLKMTSDSKILKTLNETLLNHFKELSKKEILNQADYEQLILRESYSQLIFDAPLSFGIMTRYFSSIPEEYQNETFSRIIYRYDNPQEVYFIDDETKQLYFSQTDLNIPEIFSKYYDDENFYAVESYILKNKQIFIEANTINVEKRMYLMEQIPINFYIAQLFNNPSELRNRSDGQSIIYNDNLSQLKMERATNVVSYYQNRVDDEKLSYTLHLQQSFSQMKKLGRWRLGMSFVNYDPTYKLVEYMRYVDSYPILDEAEGIAQFVVTTNGLEKMRLSSLIAETPIPSKHQILTMISGSEMINRILGKEIALHSIDDIRIGYSWKKSSESDQIVEFIPNWYLKIDGLWRTVDELVGKTTSLIESGGESNGL